MLEYLGKNTLGNCYTQYFRIGLSKQGAEFHWIDGKNYAQNLNIYSSPMVYLMRFLSMKQIMNFMILLVLIL